MNIKEYIESGIIELYVMNALPDNEKADVEVMARLYPDIQVEIEEVQAVMQVYSQAHAVTPSPELKDKILEKFKAETQPEAQKPKAEPKAEPTLEPQNITPETQNPKPEISSSLNPQASTLNLPMLLAGLAALVLAGLAFNFYQLKETLIKEKAACEQEQNTQKFKSQKEIVDLSHKLDILKSPDTKAIAMLDPSKNTTSGFRATVYWNAKEKTTLLAIQNLPKPLSDKQQYQLWAIVDGKPVDAGVFNYSLNEIQTMKPFDNAGAFAVTLEPQGGSPKPTSDIRVLGTTL